MAIRTPFAHRAMPVAIAMALGASAQAYALQDTADSKQVEEVIVTATKRAADIQDVSLSVTAIGGEQLRLGGVDDLSRLDGMVPGMQFGASGEEVRLAIRGTRTNNVGSEAEQVVGIFEDGVYVPTSTQAMGSYVDLARIEVLRGPQGTLYGRNTFGGTINIVSNEPTTDEVNGYVHVLTGNYARTKAELAINVPVTDNFAIRYAGMLDTRDGYIENTYVDGPSDDMNDQDVKYHRLTGKLTINDNNDVVVRIVDAIKDTNGSAIWGYQQTGAFVGGVYSAGHQYAPADATADFDMGPWKVRRDVRGEAYSDTTGVTVVWSSGSLGFADLRVTANHTEYFGEQGYDQDYSDGTSYWGANQFYGYYNDQETDSIEVQLTSNSDGALEWLGGIYYYEQDAAWQYTEISPDRDVIIPHWDDIGSYTSSSLGVFGNATYSINDDLRVTGGLRYTEDDKGKRDPLDWNVWPPVPIAGAGADNSWDKWLWKLGVENDLNDDQMLYATLSTGYRAGGFNIIRDGVPPIYEPETVLAAEVGLKNTLLDGAMTLNMAGYYNQYRDMHAQSFIATGNGGVTEYTENGGEIDSYGLEAELNWHATERLTISGSAALAKSEFGDYAISKVAGLGDLGGRQDLNDANSPLLSLDGWAPALAPEFTMGLQVSYDIPMSGGSTLRPYLQTYFSSEYYGHDINMDEGNLQKSYTRTDARLIWTSSDDMFEIQGYVLNLEDDAQMLRGLVFNPSGTSDLASVQTQWSNPRTMGASMTVHF